jgi:internalin A
VAEERLQDSLSEILNNLGAALNYRNDPRLREATVLQPEWLTNHVYALMPHAETQEGMFRKADLAGVLSDEPDEAMREYLVQLMERCEIAYAPKTGAGFWLVPQALL